MKYIVMECNGEYAVLLDEEAGFVRAVNADYEVGQTVEAPKLIKNTAKRNRIIMRVTAAFAAAAACLGIVFGINRYQQYMTPYSYITVSINPDVRMELNRYGQVLSLEGLNEDGMTLIKDYDPDRQDKTQVSDDLIDRAIEMGFLSEGAAVIFEIDTPDEQLFKQYSMELRSEAELHTRSVSQVQIIVRHKDDTDDDSYDYDDDDYEPVVIPIPTQTQTESATSSVTTPTTAPSSVGDTDYGDNDDGVTDYGNTTAAPTNPPTQAPTSPPAAPTSPPTNPPVVNGNSGYDNGNSGYEADSGYDD